MLVVRETSTEEPRPSRPRIRRRHLLPNHRGTRNGTKWLARVGGHRPLRAAESVADMMAEEGADSTRPRICDAKLSSPRKNYRIGDHYEMAIDASLEIAQQMIPARDMVAEMAEGLRDLPPPLRPVAPARGAIELLVVFFFG